MTGREIIKKTIEFDSPERIGLVLDQKYCSDIGFCSMNPHVDNRPSNTYDEWGAYWENIGLCNLGEVKEPALKSWDDFDNLKIPDVLEEKRWGKLPEIIKKWREQNVFLIGNGMSLYERPHFLRSLEGLWTDIYTNPDELEKLLDLMVDINLKAIKKYSDLDYDGYMFCDDWGLQDRLMISPDKWREFWKPRYQKVYQECHRHGLKTFLHSCGYIIDILDDLIECGLDVIQMDQQQNMGLDLLQERFAGRITFWCPVDIQNVMINGSTDEIRSYCHELVEKLSTPKGGFIAKWYSDPIGAGHSEEAVKAMSEEFMKIAGLQTTNCEH
ncbi:MAG: uroporphyrinogen decarboxylase family protein [Planctomycetota bacterium]|jgi:hypothetical protein